MRYSEHALDILATISFKGIGKAWIVKHLSSPKPIEEITALIAQHSREKNVSKELFMEKRCEIKSKLTNLEGHCDGIVALGDKDFPFLRGSISDGDTPVVLFYRGELSLLARHNKNVSVIGLLSPDEQIERAERIVVSELVKKGVTIVSGLALGCDSIAHKQTVELNATTVAILPGTLSDIIPQSNKNLADRIVDNGGLLVTEYYQEIRSKKELITRYIERDRLQALFCDCIVLVASFAPNKEGKDSGARHAMEYARKYGIPRAVIYNEHKHKGNPMFDLNRLILKEDAKVYRIDNMSLAQFASQIPTRDEPSSKQVAARDEQYSIFSAEDFL